MHVCICVSVRVCAHMRVCVCFTFGNFCLIGFCLFLFLALGSFGGERKNMKLGG